MKPLGNIREDLINNDDLTINIEGHNIDVNLKSENIISIEFSGPFIIFDLFYQDSDYGGMHQSMSLNMNHISRIEVY